MILPVGRFYQELLVIEKGSDGNIRRRTVAPVTFVPMTGEAQKRGSNAR
jgi:protein-L-isoaspartate O-methyltransferase